MGKKRKGVLPELSVEWILKRCERDDHGHLIWTGNMRGGKDAPMANTGESCNDVPFMVRRAIWRLMHNRQPRANKMVRARCGVYGCVEPSCLQEMPLSEKMRGVKQPLLHRARIAQAKRAKSKLAGKVDDIRTSTMSREALAEKHGCSVAMVGYIQTGKNWKNYADPAAALMR